MALDFDTRHALVLAIAHELGNHLGGIRLEAHLLGDDLDPRELARASVGIDSMAGRSGALLGLVRPLLMPGERSSGEASWLAVLRGVQQELVDQGTRGVELVFDLVDQVACPAPPVGWLHHLLMAWLGATLSQLQEREGEKGSLRVELIPNDSGASLVFEDDGPEEDFSEKAPCRGRPLALAIARVLLAEFGGHVNTSLVAGEAGKKRNRVVWLLPASTVLNREG